MEVIWGGIGFLLCYLYDINSVRRLNKVFQSFFSIGFLLIAAATVRVIWRGCQDLEQVSFLQILFILGSLLFFSALIYTLFFALPFEATYVKDSEKRDAYTSGVYALCRHPGVLWFSGGYLCLGGLLSEQNVRWFFFTMIIMNILYVIFQDIWTFPHTFTNYKKYKQKTPFLVPNRHSIEQCIRNLREERG